MRILLLRPGRFKDEGAKASCETWLTYVKRYQAVELRELQSPALKKARTPPAQMEAEAELILRGLAPSCILVTADRGGRQVSSEWFADMVREARGMGRELVFAVGGAHGLSPRVIERAAHSVAFGRITLNHDLAAAVLAEQIWRGVSLLHNHPYHK